MNLSEEFQKNICEVYGDIGRQWLANLPQHLQALSRKYDLRSMTPVANLSYNYVAIVENAKNEKWVLKTAPQGADYRKETLWLKMHAEVAPQVHLFDEGNNAFFMEFIPSLRTLQETVYEGSDEKATEVLAGLIHKMYSKPVPILEDIPHLSTLISSFQFLKGKLSDAFVDKARTLWRDLTVAQASDVFLHGDLHHDNVLVINREAKVIDPHGYIGDPCSEVGSLIYNPLGWEALHDEKPLRRRLEILGEVLPFDKKKICAWAFAKTMLSMAWTVEGSGLVPPHELKIAEILENEL
ncbi:aminoglycoside phosphotransferase family protein [Bdellovibrio sp. HCB117]|uniref:aminoglycoside phosphotransferase family protein n=1 Tax=Bdellovibrio sp. HCB117 TaxID=3394359 RepID=UPI0039B4CD92